MVTIEGTNKGPLSGVRVLDFGQYIAGPLMAMLLGDQGAEVVRIDPPGGPSFEHPANAVLSRNKHSIVLNLKEKADQDFACSLIRTADIVIENFRPGVMERLGLGSSKAAALNPDVIYVSLPGFASTDRELKNVPAWEGVLGAACGLFTNMNIKRKFYGLPPMYSALPIPSVYGAVHGALAATLALRERQESGRGQRIEIPLAAAALSGMSSVALKVHGQPARYDSPPVPRLVSRVIMPLMRKSNRKVSREALRDVERKLERAVPALMNSYRCSDGRLLYVFAIDHRRLAVNLCATMGIWEELHGAGLVNEDPFATGFSRNNLSESSNLSRKWQSRLRNALAERLAEKPAHYWETILNEAGVPCAVQRTTSEWLELEEVVEGGMLVDVKLADGTSLRQPGLQTWFVESEIPDFHEGKTIDKDDRLVARWLETSRRTSTGMSELGAGAKGLLQGLTVLDLSSMVAGPTCGRALAEFGADVIKIECPQPLHGPRQTCWYGIDVNQGKRSLLLDLKAPESRKLFEPLVREADVLIHNYTQPATERMGITYEQVHALNPHLVYCAIGAYRGPKPGSWSERPAYDPVLQAASGIMTRYGSAESPELHGIASCVDALTGYSAAFGIALGLYRRSQAPDEPGAAVGTSLANGAQLVQIPFMLRGDDGSVSSSENGDGLGEAPNYRLYRAKDGWFFLAAPSDSTTRLLESLGLSSEMDDGPDRLDDVLPAHFAMERVEVWCSRLAHLKRVGVLRVQDLDELSAFAARRSGDQGQLSDMDTLRTIRQRHPAAKWVTSVLPGHIRLQRNPLQKLSPAPRAGADTVSICREMDLDEFEIAELLRKRVIGIGLSCEYLPN